MKLKEQEIKYQIVGDNKGVAKFYCREGDVLVTDRTNRTYEYIYYSTEQDSLVVREMSSFHMSSNFVNERSQILGNFIEDVDILKSIPNVHSKVKKDIKKQYGISI
ncbi:MAG: hypothetical protein FWF57_01820 [Defluviitaleaceae bacterium]|nr:hypothetical protein [Defluviitaleaceae bacterium]